MTPAQSDLLTTQLKGVSRSFYLTLRALPSAIRPQIALAYLLARTSDTIADTQLIEVEERIEALRAFRDSVLCARPVEIHPKLLAQRQKSEAEQRLIERTAEMAEHLRRSSDSDQLLIKEVFETISSGQELDLARFGRADSQGLAALASDAELDDYTYRVAGCVGKFWTQMCRAHLFGDRRVDERFLLENGIRFGKGLQLVNILRDLPRDLRQGRCYLPENRLSQMQLRAPDLLEPGLEPKVRPLFDEYLSTAEEHLKAGWAYTLALPKGCARVRLACAWPALIGVATLNKLRRGPFLDPARVIKISRRELRGILIRTVLAYPRPRIWSGLFARSQQA